MWSKAPGVEDKGERETSVNSCGPRNLEWETSVGDKWETSVKSSAPRHPEWEISVGHKWKTSANSCAQGTQV